MGGDSEKDSKKVHKRITKGFTKDSPRSHKRIHKTHKGPEKTRSDRRIASGAQTVD